MKNFTTKIALVLFMITQLSYQVKSGNIIFPDCESFAKIQLIHNAADLAADTVDVFVNDELFLSDFAFRTATPFVDVPAGVELTIDVAPAGAGIESSVFDITVTFEADETYIIVANGIVSASGYDPVEPFTVYPFAGAREVAANENETDVLVFHGATDAPEVSVWETGVGAGELFTFGYGDFAGYLALGTLDYILEVRTADGETTVAAYEAPLQTLGLEGAAITVVASGFLNPANNSDGPAFGLFVATAAGGELIPLPVYEENEEEITCAYSQGYWFANPNTVWPYDVEVGGLTFTQEDGQDFWPPMTNKRRAFTQYSAIYLSGVTLSLFPELEDAMETIDNYFANVYPYPAGIYVNRAAGFIGDWIDHNHCDDQEPEPEFARAQIIHNAADMAAANVDIFVNGEIFVPDFAFRTATPFVDVPAGVELTIDVAPAGAGIESSVFDITVTFEADETYIIVANGIVSASGYDPVEPFTVYPFAGAREVAANENETDVLVFHGATDAPEVSVWETGVGAGELFTFGYGDFAGYLALGTLDYILEVRTADGETTVAAYEAPLQTLGLDGAAITVVASGFLNPANNSDGPAFGLYVALAGGGDLIPLPLYEEPEPEFARAQIIHNAADMAAANVDIFVNGEIFVPDFAFRTATPFVDVPAGVELTIDIAPAGAGIESSVFDITVTFEADETYIIVANGIVSASGYDPVEPFTVYPFAGAREVATNENETDVLVFHGATDAPTVSVWETGVGAGELFTFGYGDYAGYLALGTLDYILEVRTADGETTVAAYEAPLQTLGLDGAAITVVASGFLNPANNSDGPAFGLYVALAGGGDLIPLPLYEEPEPATARAQIIHNSADAAAAVVDVWVNETKLLENFAFRTATPFIDAPAGVLLNIGIAPPNSTSWTQSFSIKQVVLTEDQTYVIVATGITSASGYSPSPTFDVKVYPIGRETASQPENTDVLVMHGATDAPTVDVYETGVGAGLVVDDLTYGNVAGYLELETLDYIIEVRDETGTTTVAAYQAPLATLGLEGAAISVLASGFLNPANNSDGPAFGLYVALAGGGDLIPLPIYEEPEPDFARAQIIHNAADMAAANVDIFVNGEIFVPNFAFRTATPFVDVPAGVELTIDVAPAGAGIESSVFDITVTFDADETYIIVANGIVSASGYDPVEPFTVYPFAGAREVATNENETDVLVFHGATDAPEVSVWETGVGAGELFTFGYGDFAGYLELGTLDYILEVRTADGETTVAAYEAPLQTLGLDGAAITVVASGFLNPANNSDGPAFGLYVALAGGGDLIALPLSTNVNEIAPAFGEFNVYPNPFRDHVSFNFSLKESSYVLLDVYNLDGKRIAVLFEGYVNANENYNFSLNSVDMTDGIYFYRLTTPYKVHMEKLILAR